MSGLVFFSFSFPPRMFSFFAEPPGKSLLDSQMYDRLEMGKGVPPSAFCHWHLTSLFFNQISMELILTVHIHL